MTRSEMVGVSVFVLSLVAATWGGCTILRARADCDARHCDRGSPTMLQGRCICVEAAKP